MKFILKDNHIFIVENDALVYNNIEAQLILDGIYASEEAKLEFSVNNGLYRNVENKLIVIDKKELKDSYFELKIRILDKDKVELYESDKIPTTHALILGQPMEERYPKIIRSIIHAIERLEEKQEEIIKVLEYLDSKGDIL